MGTEYSPLKKEIKRSYVQGLLFSQHAVDRMNMPSRLITVPEIKEVVEYGRIVEEYPDDPRGHSCLIEYKTSHQ